MVSEKYWNKGESNACCLSGNFLHFLLYIKPCLPTETLLTSETFSCYVLHVALCGQEEEGRLPALLRFVSHDRRKLWS